MKIRYLLSGPRSDTGFQGKIVEYIKKDIKSRNKFIWIASSFGNYEKNDKRFNNVLKWFSDIGIVFKNTQVIDNRIEKSIAQKEILEADVIMLSGGDTRTQIKSIKEYDLKGYLQKTDAIIFGVSAGSINMAKKVVLTKDESEELYETIIYEGIGLTNINIEPHFSLDNKEHNKDLLETSKKYNVIALPDYSSIRIEDNKETYINDCYKIEKETINKI